MSGLTLDRLRLPLALAAIAIAALVFLPRQEDKPTAATKSPAPSIIVGEPGGEVIETASPAPTPIPAATPVPTPAPTPEPTSAPPPPDDAGFSAQVLACESISGSSCNNQLGTLPPGAAQFTALVLFTDANAGDTFNAVLNGPSGTIPGGPFTLQGGGDGYYYSTFTAGNLPPGDYTLVAVRNGSEVATTTFTRG